MRLVVVDGFDLAKRCSILNGILIQGISCSDVCISYWIDAHRRVSDGARPDAVLDSRRDDADLRRRALHVVPGDGAHVSRPARNATRTSSRGAWPPVSMPSFVRSRAASERSPTSSRKIDPPRSRVRCSAFAASSAAWPDVYGSTIAVESGADASAQPFAPYLFRRADAIEFSDLARESYAYRELPWYRRAADSRAARLVVALFRCRRGRDVDGHVLGAVLSQSSPDARRVLAGVVTADLALDWVKSTAANATLGADRHGLARRRRRPIRTVRRPDRCHREPHRAGSIARSVRRRFATPAKRCSRGT